MMSFFTQFFRHNKMMLFITLCFALLITSQMFHIPWYTMHDSTHPSRLLLLKTTIADGQFPAIWAKEINHGYGYPLFHFYAPLYHYTAALFSLFTSDAIALKLSIFLYIFIGLIGIWKISARWGKMASTLAVASFGLSPYIALDLYVRGAYAEFVSLCLLPWVIYTLSRLQSVRSTVPASLATSLFLLSHNLTPIIFAPILITYLLYLKPPIKIFSQYLLLTFLLSAWFIGPLILERHFTQADKIAQTTQYSLHFVEPWQIWNSTWGYGGSAPGVEDGISFKLGKIQLILGLLGFVSALIKHHKAGILLALSALFMLLLSTSYTSWLWDHLPLLPIVQFPWRTLGVAAVLLSLLSAYFASSLRGHAIQLLFCSILSIAMIVLNYKYFVPQQAANYPTNVVDIALVVPEYLPQWMPNFPSSQSTGDLAYYPTWKVTQNGINLKTYPDQNGILRYEATPNTTPTIAQTHTQVERLSYLLTIIGLCSSLYILMHKQKA